METTRSVSKITSNFIKTLDMHASKLTHIVEDAQSVNEQKLSELEKKFEVVADCKDFVVDLIINSYQSLVLSSNSIWNLQECAANEEKQLLAKVAELLASSNLRKKQLVLLYLQSVTKLHVGIYLVTEEIRHNFFLGSKTLIVHFHRFKQQSVTCGRVLQVEQACCSRKCPPCRSVLLR